ncbi:MAG: PHP domain-containing protein [Lentisphaeria bacterium]|nr:PHP domain-containing protein [Lentisphaeria bacterium]
MDFLYKGEPGWISSVRSNDWRIFAEAAPCGLKTFVKCNEQWCNSSDCKLTAGSKGCMKFVVPDELNEKDNILMLFLPFNYIAQSKFEDLFELPENAEALWSWPVLEVRTPVEWVIVKDFPLPTQPETLFIDGWLRTAEEKFYALPEMPFAVADTPAESLQVRVSNNFTGNKVRGSVTAEQSAAARFMADRSFNNEVVLEYNGKQQKIALENGNAVFELPLEGDKPFDVKAFYPGVISGESNYADPGFLADLGYNIVWGDMHVHTRESDGMGEPAEVMRRARDWQKLDFMAFNEHIEHSLAWRVWNKAKWEKLRKLYEESTVDGEFVIIPGFEYCSYCNLWCFNDDYHTYLAPEYNREGAYRLRRADTEEGKQQAVEIQQKIAEFAAKKDWLVGYHRLEVLKTQLGKLPTPVQCLQMAHYKRPPEVGSMDYLLRGDRVAFFGGTDTHLGMPAVGYTGDRTANSGLTAALVKELDRKNLHEALLNCRTYASLGARTLCDMRLNGHIMGEAVQIPEGGNMEITFRAAGREKLKRVEIVINGENAFVQELGKNSCDCTFKTVYPTAAKGFAFARLHLEDNRILWTSPVYINN